MNHGCFPILSWMFSYPVFRKPREELGARWKGCWPCKMPKPLNRASLCVMWLAPESAADKPHLRWKGLSPLLGQDWSEPFENKLKPGGRKYRFSFLGFLDQGPSFYPFRRVFGSTSCSWQVQPPPMDRLEEAAGLPSLACHPFAGGTIEFGWMKVST